MRRVLGAIVFGTLSLSAAGLGQVPTRAIDQVIPLSYGINSVRLTHDLGGTVVLAWRENYNAHSFDVLSIYAQGVRDKLVQDARLQIVPLFSRSNGNNEQLFFRSDGGADCRLSDFRLVRMGSGDVAFITADREFGQTYADRQEVTFAYYRLTRNSSDSNFADVGRPKYYFKLDHTQKAKKTYCDVNEAFKAELGLGEDGR